MRVNAHPLAAAIAAASAGWIVAMSAQQARPAGSARVDFEQHVRPILAASCLECHSQDKRKGGLSLATYEDILEGGKDGAVVRPGNGAGSLLIHRVTGEIEPQMPKDELALSRRRDRDDPPLDRRRRAANPDRRRRRRRRGKRRWR